MEKQLVQPQQPQPQPQQPQQPQQQPSVVASVVAPPLQSGTPMIAGQASDCNNKIDNIPFCDDKYYKFKKHVCDICGYRTDVPYSLRRHKKKVHNVGTILSPKKKKGIVVHSNEPMSIDDDDDDDDEEDDIDMDVEESARDEKNSTTIGGEEEVIEDNKNSNRKKKIFNIQLEPNFKLFLSGPSKCGKSYFMGQLLANLDSIAEKPPQRVVYVYGYWQDKMTDMQAKNLVDVFIEGGGNDLHTKLRDYQRIVNNEDLLVIFDDQMMDNKGGGGLKTIAELYGQGARHMGMSLCFICQDIFYENKDFRFIRKNSDYWIFFKNPKDVQAINLISNRITTNSTLTRIYQEATVQPYSYLLIDTRQQANRYTRFLSQLFDRSHVVVTYITMGEQPTTFNKMFLVSAEAVERELDKIEQVRQHRLQQEEEEKERVKIQQAQKQQQQQQQQQEMTRMEDEEGEEEKEEKGGENRGGGGGGGERGIVRKLNDVDFEENNPQYEIKRRRDIGAGMDDDREKAREARRKMRDNDSEKAREDRRKMMLVEKDWMESSQVPLPPDSPSVEKQQQQLEELARQQPPLSQEEDEEMSEKVYGSNGRIVATEPTTMDEEKEQRQDNNPFLSHICDVCGVGLASAVGLKRHKTWKHTERVGKVAGRKRRQVPAATDLMDQILLDEMASKKARVSFEDECRCRICKKVFKTKKEFDRHVRNIHLLNPKDIENPLDRDKSGNERLRKNIKKAAINKKIVEKQESHRKKPPPFKKKSNKEKAEETLHQSSHDELCQLCNTYFRSESDLTKHMIAEHAKVYY